MKHSVLATALCIAALTLGGCAAHSTTATALHAPAFGGPVARVVDFPTTVGPGQPREVRVLVDEPALKLVTIVLRQGTLLPEHRAPIPVTIQALQGTGTLIAGTERFRIDPTHAVVLAAGVSHSVQPDPGTDLVLLVHHLGRGEESHP